MSDNPETESATSPAEATWQSTSDLNNLLQIIAVTNSLLQEPGQSTEEREKYLEMLRVSIARAESVAADLTVQSGGVATKKEMHPDVVSFSGTPKSTQASSSGSKQTIMLVDDEQMALTLMKRVMTDAGYNVATAQSGFECIDQLRRLPHKFNLILLDLTMPFMDGEETFRRIREIRSDIPVLLCAGFIQRDRLTRLMTAGLAGFLRKPVAPDEILSTVRATLNSLKYSRPADGVSALR